VEADEQFDGLPVLVDEVAHGDRLRVGEGARAAVVLRSKAGSQVNLKIRDQSYDFDNIMQNYFLSTLNKRSILCMYNETPAL
jgi:hypothetical protein